MHLYYTEVVFIYVYTVHTHIFATYVAPGVNNPTSFSFSNRPIVLFKSFQPDFFSE